MIFVKKWLHYKCSKLTTRQFNNFGNNPESLYYCFKCLQQSIPFTGLSKSKFESTLDCASKTNSLNNLSSSCNLCVECNTECEDCVLCPDLHRICDFCTKCQYLSFSAVNNLFLTKQPNDLAILHMNIRSLPKHISKIQHTLLEEFDKKTDIICITETKLYEDPETSSLIEKSKFKEVIDSVQIPGYRFFHCDSRTLAGGSAIYISSELHATYRKDLEINIDGECEAAFVEVILANQNKNLIIGSVYRHPHDNHEEFFSVFCEQVEKISKKYVVILLGDINIDYSENSAVAKYYKNVLLGLGVKNTINLPTRCTETTDTVIDHMITNQNLDKVESGILVKKVSDHLPLYCLAKLNAKKTVTNEQYSIRKFPLSKKQAFVAALQSKLESYSEDATMLEPSACMERLIVDMQNTIKKVFPLVKMSKKQRKKRRTPWMTTGILNSIDRRDKLLETWIKTKNVNDRKEYTKVRNQVTRITEKAKEKHLADQGEIAGTDKTKTWKYLNKFFKKKQVSTNSLPNELKLPDSSISSDPQEIANELNKHFVSKGPHLASQLPTANQSILKCMGPRNSSSIKFDESDTEEIINIVLDFENKNFTGNDKIPAIILKWVIHLIAPILTIIFNKCINIGVYPESLKIGKVTPLFKNGDRSDGDNFRPITLLTLLNKIFEKLLHKRMVAFINKHNILSNNQYGFRKGHSTSHAVTHLSESVIKHLEKKKVCALLFIDLKSAFDTVDIHLLLKKLDHYGFRGNALKLISSYLQGRKQFIKCGLIESSILDVVCGVPQGSVLGPLLFTLYINDFVSCSKFESILFADDAALLLADANLKKLKRAVSTEVKQMHNWLITSKLTINLKKTKYMIIANKNVITPKERKKFRITIGKYTIHEIDQIKYLGTIFDNKLNWNYHIDYLKTKLSQAAGAMYKIRKYISIDTRLVLYNSLFASYLQYGILAWGSASPTSINSIQSLQNRIVRYMTFSPPFSNVDSKYKSLKILRVQDLYRYESAKFMHSVCLEYSPMHFQTYFQAIDHNHDTRTKRNVGFAIPQPRTERGKKSLRYTCVKSWASIPEFLKSTPPKMFKYRLKNYLLSIS